MSAADEGSHAPGPELRWAESWTFDFVSGDADLGGWVRLTTLPNLGVGWYHAFLCGAGRDLVAVVDHDVPTPDRTLEIRTHGLWATHICETPLDHWTIGLEAFGIEVDDPAELYGRQLGTPRALGFDLEWEAVSPAEGAAAAYHQASRVSGEVLVGDEVIDLDGFGRRAHAWGPAVHWDTRWFRAHGALDDGTRFSATLVGGDLAGGTGTLGGTPVELRHVGQQLTSPGLPEAAEIDLGGLGLALNPTAVTTLELVDPEGRRTRAPRALCRVESTDGRSGAGWVEWNTPVS